MPTGIDRTCKNDFRFGSRQGFQLRFKLHRLLYLCLRRKYDQQQKQKKG